MRATYPSDISREQFEAIRYIFESLHKVTHPRIYDLYDIFCAIPHILSEGCRWRLLEHDYPKRNNVQYHYQAWSKQGADNKSTLDKALEELTLSARVINGKEAQPSMMIVDSKRVKNAFTAAEKGYDGGKKISGIKVPLGVDTLGLPHSIGVTTAEVGDRTGALQMLGRYAPKLARVVKVLGDGGYSGENFANAVMSLLNAEVEIVKRNELHTFVVFPKRWVVERSLGWLDHFRRLWKNCERKLCNVHQMLVLAFISLLLPRY